jgi:hypothetical protein
MVCSFFGLFGFAVVVGVHLAVSGTSRDYGVQLQLCVKRKALPNCTVQVDSQCRDPQDWPKE